MENHEAFDGVWEEMETKLHIRVRPQVRRWAQAKYGYVLPSPDDQTRNTVLEMLQQDVARMRAGGIDIEDPDATQGSAREDPCG